MASFTAKSAVDFLSFDISWYTSSLVRWNFLNNTSITMGGTVYSDVSYATANNGVQSELFLFGPSIKAAGSGRPVSGGITALQEVVGDTFSDPHWTLKDIALPAALLVKAIRTPQTTDDMALLARMLAGADTVNLSKGDDQFNGYSGNDTIFGNDGDDVLIGGSGQDFLSGGDGADVFIFGARDTANGLLRDEIDDFNIDEDTIDLSQIDANVRVRGNQDFAFSGPEAAANSVWFVHLDGNTTIFADVNGDAKADLSLVLLQSEVVVDNFLL